jgi:hypothetical protein
MIGGAVENASRESIVSWASFFLGNGPSLPPIESRFQNKSCLQANISYKRRFLPRDIPPYGYMEWMHNLDLLRQGEQLRADDRIPVEHHQPVDFREACSLHFHVGRCVAGFRLPRIGPVERVVRLLAACSVMSPLLWLRSLWAVVRKRRHLGWLAISTPMIFVLAVCRAAGAVVGLIAGSGDSPLVVP